VFAEQETPGRPQKKADGVFRGFAVDRGEEIPDTDRQAKALGHMVEHGSLTIQDFEGLCPDVNRRSLQRDLKAMIEKGVVVEKATSPTDPTKHYVLMESTPE
jgi:hypothetical protein